MSDRLKIIGFHSQDSKPPSFDVLTLGSCSWDESPSLFIPCFKLSKGWTSRVGDDLLIGYSQPVRISTWSGYDSPSLKRAAILPGNQWNQRFRNTGCLARFTGNPRPPALKKIIHHHYLSKGGSEPPHFRVLGAAKTPLFQNPWEICNFSMHFQYISPQNNGVLWCSVRSIFLESHLELTPVALRSEKVGRREACTSLLILHLDDRKWRDQRLRI